MNEGVSAAHLEVLVEEPSAEEALRLLLPRLLGPGVTFRIHPHQGKSDLLGKLPGRLKGYNRWGPDLRLVVLVDADRADCRKLKASLEVFAHEAGLVTQSVGRGEGQFQVLNRLAVEELEAWFFGDVGALCAAYPGVPASLASRARFRDPDAIRGGTWEALQGVLQRAGHHRGGLAKMMAARDIAQHMDPDRNRSRSFQTFRRGLTRMCGPR